MSFEWYSHNDCYNLRSQFNIKKAACVHFEDVNYVLLGIDRENKQIGNQTCYKAGN